MTPLDPDPLDVAWQEAEAEDGVLAELARQRRWAAELAIVGLLVIGVIVVLAIDRATGGS